MSAVAVAVQVAGRHAPTQRENVQAQLVHLGRAELAGPVVAPDVDRPVGIRLVDVAGGDAGRRRRRCPGRPVPA